MNEWMYLLKEPYTKYLSSTKSIQLDKWTKTHGKAVTLKGESWLHSLSHGKVEIKKGGELVCPAIDDNNEI